jgi:peptidyl-prolyl cis-trans isomerase A (cyclophilin A)
MTLAAGTYAVFTTTEGKITVRLFESDAPITVKNFIELAEGAKEWTHPTTRAKSTDKLFDGTIFHRVIPDFMIQGGDPTGTGMGGPGYRFEDETKGSPHKFDKPGKLAMANSGPGTNGCQFFITVAATPWLTGNHTIFGEVVEGRRSRTKSPKSPAAARTSPRPPSSSNPSSSSASANLGFTHKHCPQPRVFAKGGMPCSLDSNEDQ